MIVSVIIPCYNVARHIEEVIRNLPSQINYIITVNDCSPDETETIIHRLLQTEKRIIYLKHELNQGVGGAMLTGFKKSIELNSDITIKMDGDNQMDPVYIPALIKPLMENEADFTKGNRFRDFKALRKMPISRRIGNLGLSFLIKTISSLYSSLLSPLDWLSAFFQICSGISVVCGTRLSLLI